MYNLCISVHIKTFCIRMNVSSRVCVTDTCSLPCRGPLLNESLLTHDSPTHSHVRMSHVIYTDVPCHTSIESHHTHESNTPRVRRRVLQCVAVCCSVLQCVALCRSVLQRAKASCIHRSHWVCICVGICVYVAWLRESVFESICVYESRVVYARSHWVTPHDAQI